MGHAPYRSFSCFLCPVKLRVVPSPIILMNSHLAVDQNTTSVLSIAIAKHNLDWHGEGNSGFHLFCQSMEGADCFLPPSPLGIKVITGKNWRHPGPQERNQSTKETPMWLRILYRGESLNLPHPSLEIPAILTANTREDPATWMQLGFKIPLLSIEMF